MQIQSTYQQRRPTLFLITTPIGNLQAVSGTVKPVLARLDYLLCEDTRHTQKLINHLKLHHLKLISFHKFNEHQRSKQVLTWLAKQSDVGLVSCAGTPLIADPGFKLVQTALLHNYWVTTVGLNNSGLAALITSGLPTHQFYFLNFLTHSLTKKRQLLTKLLPIKTTFVLFEAVHRLKATLQLCKTLLPDHAFALARELTKQHETIYRGIFRTLALEQITLRGEFVLVIDNNLNQIELTHQLNQFQAVVTPLGLTLKQQLTLGTKLCQLPRKLLKTTLYSKSSDEKNNLS